jgi:glycosyltransferase involved in cell wall biosynthesis
MTSEPLVSIALPTFNSARTIGQAIQSMRLQTYTRWELLLADGGSTDDTLKIVRAFADDRIKLLPSAGREGLSKSLNRCIDHAQGSLLARMDADDVSYPERFEKQLVFLESHPDVDLAGAQAIVFGAGGKAIGKRTAPCTHDLITRHPLHGFRMAHPTWMGRIEWFRRYRYDPDAVLSEDQELLLRAFRYSVYANLPDVLLGYREEKLNLAYIWRSRWVRLERAAKSPRDVISLPALASMAIVTGLKAGLDWIAVVSGLGHRLLRQRAGKMSESEEKEWDLVWLQTQEPKADVSAPARS